MTAETALSLEERLRHLLDHLGITKAHLAGRSPQDWSGFVTRYPEAVASLTVIGGFDPRIVEPLAARLLVVASERGPTAEPARNAASRLAGAQFVALRDYDLQGWSDVIAERTDEIAATVLQFLGRITPPATIPLREGEGEVAGITYGVQGAGPPLLLLPFFLAPSQWEPLVPQLSQRYCTITLGGAFLGAVAILESRGRATGYLHVVRTLIKEAQLLPGETVLEVGCGTGVLDRWLARRTAGANRITGVDINRYLLGEARALARQEAVADTIEFLEGNAESLPFPDSNFDLAMSVTVIEEVDAERMLTEMVRVTKPGGRVAVAARAMDMPFLMNLPLAAGVKAKVEAAGAVGGVSLRGCADVTLYRRVRDAGLTGVKMLPQLAVFDRADAPMLQFMQDQLLAKLSREEAAAWHAARAQAEADNTFFMTFPHHCAIGTKAS